MLARFAKEVMLPVVTVARIAGTEGWKTLAYSTPKSRFSVVYVEDDQFENGQYLGKKRTPFSQSKLAGKFGLVMEVLTRIPTSSVTQHTLFLLCHTTFTADRIFDAANSVQQHNVDVHNVVSLEWNTLKPYQYEYDVEPESASDYDSDDITLVGRPVTYRHRKLARDAEVAADTTTTINEQQLRCEVDKAYASLYIFTCRDLNRFTAVCQQMKPQSGLFLIGLASNAADFTERDWWSRITCASTATANNKRRYIRNNK